MKNNYLKVKCNDYLLAVNEELNTATAISLQFLEKKNNYSELFDITM